MSSQVTKIRQSSDRGVDLVSVSHALSQRRIWFVDAVIGLLHLARPGQVIGAPLSVAGFLRAADQIERAGLLGASQISALASAVDQLGTHIFCQHSHRGIPAAQGSMT